MSSGLLSLSAVHPSLSFHLMYLLNQLCLIIELGLSRLLQASLILSKHTSV
jgi:hypothetical protein